MRKPYGKCRYCGAEIMSKANLERHESVTCPHRPITDLQAMADDSERSRCRQVEQQLEDNRREACVKSEERPRWRQVTQAGGAIGWIRQ